MELAVHTNGLQAPQRDQLLQQIRVCTWASRTVQIQLLKLMKQDLQLDQGAQDQLSSQKYPIISSMSFFFAYEYSRGISSLMLAKSNQPQKTP